MALSNTHPTADLLRYFDGLLGGEEKRALEEHLETCTECQGYLSFVRDAKHNLADLSEEEFTSYEPCPGSSTLVSYAAGKVDEETARHLRVHVLFCDACAEEYQALRRLRPKSIEAILRVAGGLIKALRVSGVAEWQTLSPAVVTRGTKRVFVAPFRVSETFVDLDTGVESTVTLRVEEDLKPDRVRVIVECDPLPQNWKLALSDAEQEELTSIPITEHHMAVRSEVPYGLYALEILSGEECLGRFAFTVERFNLPEAIKTATEYLRLAHYSRAMAVLEDAAECYPNSQEVCDLQCLTRALAASDTEGFEREQGEFGQVRGVTDFLKETREVLGSAKKKFGEGIAYVFAVAEFDPEPLPEDVFSRLREEKATLSVLSALELLREHVKESDERLARILGDFTSRLGDFSGLMKGLQQSIDGVRADVEKDVNEKFGAITKLLEPIEKMIAQRGLSVADYSPLFRERLGDAGWSWLGLEAQKIFVSAEGLYWYLAGQPILEAPDFSPALLQFCRGLELLLNIKLRSLCAHIQETVSANNELRNLASSQLPKTNLDITLHREATFSMTQVANLLRIGKVIQQTKPASFKQDRGALLASSPGITDIEFIGALDQLGMFFRNGKIHPRAGSMSLFTTLEEMHILRKLMFGFDEDRVDSSRFLSRLRNAPWLSEAQRLEAHDKMSRVWKIYPGLVNILYKAFAASLNA